MSISLERVAEKYLVARKLSDGTRKEYRSTVFYGSVAAQNPAQHLAAAGRNVA